MFRLINKTTNVLAVSALLLAALAFPVSAKEVTVADKTLIKPSDQFNQPEQIIVAPIFMPTNTVSFVDSEDWYKSIYYYTTARLNFPDIPYHYIVDSVGTVYIGNGGGDEQKPNITNESNAILVGYLANRLDSGINPRASQGMSDLLTKVANKHNIKTNKISIKRIDIMKNDAEKIVYLESNPILQEWVSSFNEIKERVNDKFKPQPKQYSFEITDVKLPGSAINYGETPEVKFTIKNTGENAVFQGSSSELLLATSNGNSSRFFVNNKWASNNAALLMAEKQVIKSGDSVEVSVPLSTPLIFTEIREEFVLQNGNGTKFTNAKFVIKLTVNRPSKKVVEITATELGYLRVRSEPSINASEVARVSPGQRYIVLEENDGGWQKLDLGNGKIGWVTNRYTRTV